MPVPRAIRYWDVKIPPPKKRMMKGYLMVSTGVMVQRLRRKPRRITIEIHSDTPRSILRSSSSMSQSQMEKVAGKTLTDTKLGEDDMVFIRILRHPRQNVGKEGNESDDDDDDENLNIFDSVVSDDREQDVWAEYKRYVLDDVVILKKFRNSIDLKLGRGQETEVRNVIFDAEEDVSAFCGEIDHLLEQRRLRASGQMVAFEDSSRRMGVSLGQLHVHGDNVKILVEIVASYNLPQSGMRKIDPYVNVFMGPQQIHKTDHISRSQNPIWTIQNGSIFLLEMATDDFFHNDGMSFVVMDFQSVGRNNIVGKATIKQSDILEGKGERREFPLFSENDSPLFGSMIVLRFRHATKNDILFMKEFKSKSKGIGGVRSNEAFTPPVRASAGIAGVLKNASRKNSAGVVEYRVKPGPDPARKQSTTWMTETEIDRESRKKSQKWIEVGSGNLGRVYFEILGCDGLPNLDGVLVGKDDCFASIVVEDSVVNSEVIVDCNSPRWMPWTQRAFIFNIDHPSSQILLGIIDHDTETAVSSHDAIGRVAVDITNFRPETQYTLTYNLYTSGYVENHDAVGTVTVRLRTQWHSVRAVYMKSLTFPNKNYVNTSKKHDFQTACFSVIGKENIYDFDFDVLKSYGNEFAEMENVIHYIKLAAATVILWRGHFPFSLPLPWYKKDANHMSGLGLEPARVDCNLPLHSIVAFTGGVMLAENFNLLPSFFFFSIAWFFLATSEHIRRHPSPWSKPRSIQSMYSSLVTGHIGQTFIREFENAEDAEAFEAWEKAELEADRSSWRDTETKADDPIVEEIEKEEAELRRMESGQENITSKSGSNISLLGPLKAALLPIQLTLGKILVMFRIGRSLVTWEASYYAFFILNVSLLMGFLLLFVPWDKIFRWMFRLVVWVFLGPQMKLVDMLYVQNTQSRQQRRLSAYANQSMAVAAAMRARQIRNEKILKLKDMKCYLFGKYIIEVPRFKEYRYRDVPLPNSFAVPFNGCEEVPPEQILAVKKGQYLLGDMIPVWVKRPTKFSHQRNTNESIAQSDDQTINKGIRQEERKTRESPSMKRRNFFSGFTEHSINDEQLSLLSQKDANGNITPRYDAVEKAPDPTEDDVTVHASNSARGDDFIQNSMDISSIYVPLWQREEVSDNSIDYVEV